MSAPFVAVIGTVNLDTIVTADGQRLESLGGILYNAIPLGALLEATGISVRLYGRLGEAHRDQAIGMVEPFPGIDATTLVADPGGTNLSLLDYSRGGERREEVEMRVQSLSRPDLRGAEGARAVLVNMISGQDVTRETLGEVRGESSADFLLDIQALARTFAMPRRVRVVPHRKEWCRVFDVIRGNEEEIAHFGGVPDDPAKAAEQILREGPSEVLATRGEHGSWRASLEPEGLVRTDVPPDPWRPATDPTGCGDAFLAGVCAGRVVGLDPLTACRLGSYTAARVAGLSGIASLARLQNLAAEAAEHDAAWSALLARAD